MYIDELEKILDSIPAKRHVEHSYMMTSYDEFRENGGNMPANQAMEHPFVASVDDDFHSSHAMASMHRYLVSGRADTLKEAMAVYRNELAHAELQMTIHQAATQDTTFIGHIVRNLRKF